MADKPEDIKQEEQDLKEYLEGESTLSRAYRAEEKAQVPIHLDKAIFSAANEAVRSERVSKAAYSPFARSWYVPASMVAVLMLCVGLVFTIYRDSGQTLLTTPKSEYDIDTQISPIESSGKFKPDESGEKNRRAEKSMDEISEANKPVPTSIEGYQLEEPELEKRPASKKVKREEMIEMDDALQPGLSEKHTFEKDAARQTRSDLPYNAERRDESGSREAADVKKQEQLDINALSNKPGEVELKDNEKEIDSAQESHYRQTKESLSGKNGLLQGELLKSEVMDDDMAVDAFASPTQSMKHEIMPEQWLKQINNLWISGDQQIAKENLTLFFETYPDYSIEDAKAILDPQIDLFEYIR
jgi:hypothetical protein